MRKLLNFLYSLFLYKLLHRQENNTEEFFFSIVKNTLTIYLTMKNINV